jgi:hypothetical protein
MQEGSQPAILPEHSKAMRTIDRNLLIVLCDTPIMFQQNGTIISLMEWRTKLDPNSLLSS